MTQIKLRRDLYRNWIYYDPVLGSGEPAYETDTGKLKVGDGSSVYSKLAYLTGDASVDTYTKEETNLLLDEKQDVLEFDDTPTEDSTNPVTSAGIKEYVESKTVVDSALSDTSTNPVQNKAVTEAINNIKVSDILQIEYAED